MLSDSFDQKFIDLIDAEVLKHCPRLHHDPGFNDLNYLQHAFTDWFAGWDAATEVAARIATSTPHLRRQFRNELLDELIEEMMDRQGSREFSPDSQADCLYLADVLRNWKETDDAQ